MKKPVISIIAAIGKNRELGKDNKLLWHIPDDMKRFRELTKGHAVIMGRKTYDSIGKTLPNRLNLVLSRNPYKQQEGIVRDIKSPCIFVVDLVQALEKAKKWEEKKENPEVFIIGGGNVYEQALPLADKLYLTVVEGKFDADTYFPEYSRFEKVLSEKKGEYNGLVYRFLELLPITNN